VTENEGIGSAVLIRSIEPLEGIDTMLERRNITMQQFQKNPYILSNGPAKLCQALRIDRTLNYENLLVSHKIWIEESEASAQHVIVSSRRIGISKSVDKEWRFHIRHNKWVSRMY
jgi:DNA-3-methyladenine glycosylase